MPARVDREGGAEGLVLRLARKAHTVSGVVHGHVDHRVNAQRWHRVRDGDRQPLPSFHLHEMESTPPGVVVRATTPKAGPDDVFSYDLVSIVTYR